MRIFKLNTIVMLPRPDALARIDRSLERYPVTALLGPRQCGKTTLARTIVAREPCEFFDLESPVDRGRLSASMTALQRLNGLVIIDEVPRLPDLFELIRVLVDRPQNPARFLLLESASPGLVRGLSEPLAGRIGFVDLSGFDVREAGGENQNRLWMRGGFLAPNDAASLDWRENFIRTFLERSHVAKVTLTSASAGSQIVGEFNYGQSIRTFAPPQMSNLVHVMLEMGVEVSARDPSSSSWLGHLISWTPIVIMIAFLIFFMRAMQGSAGGVSQMDRRERRLEIKARFLHAFTAAQGELSEDELMSLAREGGLIENEALKALYEMLDEATVVVAP